MGRGRDKPKREKKKPKKDKKKKRQSKFERKWWDKYDTTSEYGGV
jgi:hypothetical protein